jgi:hypothetical protein
MGSALIEEGQAIVRQCLRHNQPGAYQPQAAINAVHADAPTVEETDWSQIVTLYDQLLAVAPTPVVALNRAIAIGEAPRRRSSWWTNWTSTTTSTLASCQPEVLLPESFRSATRLQLASEVLWKRWSDDQAISTGEAVRDHQPRGRAAGAAAP